MAKTESGILAGVKVVSSATMVAGPFAAAMLAENGADVIEIENPDIPDNAKNFGKLYSMEHRNERSLGLDLKSEEGKAVLRKLLASADIFIEGSRPGAWARLGFDDEALWEIKRDLVIVHVSGYGQSGDPHYTGKPAYDMIGQAFSGTLALNGMADPYPPTYSKPYVCDYFSGLAASWGALAALLKARETGVGESVDVAMFETMARMQGGFPVDGFALGTQPERIGNTDANVPLDVIYKTKDENWVALAIAMPNEAWMKAIGLADDPEFMPISFIGHGHPGAAKYSEAVKRWAAEHTLDEVLAAMGECRVAGEAVMTYEMMKTNSHYIARDTIVGWYDPITKQDIQGITTIPRFKNNPGGVFRGSPTIGMDNDDVLREIGYSPDEINALHSCGAIGAQ